MLNAPSIYAAAAKRNACPAGTRGASHKTGMGASQSSGQTGVSPVPKKNKAADAVRQRATTTFRLGFKAMKHPPDRTANQGAKLLFRQIESAAPVERDITMGMGPQFHRQFPHIILFQVAGFHGRLQQIGDGIQGGGAAGAEILRKAARTRPRLSKDVIEDSRVSE